MPTKLLFLLFPQLQPLFRKVDQIMKTQADMQARLDAQAEVITQVEAQQAAEKAEIAALQASQSAPVDLTPQVDQLDAQTARMQALLPSA